MAVAILLCAATAEARPAKVALDGVVRVAPRGHCGGAYIRDYEPPEPAPAPNVTLLIRKGDKNSSDKPAAEVTTGADGAFHAELAPGRYCVVFADKRSKPRKGGQYVELKCLIADWSRCDAVTDVPSDAPLAIDRRTACFGPCYHGPMPP